MATSGWGVLCFASLWARIVGREPESALPEADFLQDRPSLWRNGAPHGLGHAAAGAASGHVHADDARDVIALLRGQGVRGVPAVQHGGLAWKIAHREVERCDVAGVLAAALGSWGQAAADAAIFPFVDGALARAAFRVDAIPAARRGWARRGWR